MKNFSIFKNTYKKEGSTQPDYKIMVSLEKDAPLTEAGGCWKKEGKNGTFISCKLSDAYVDHTKGTARKGFELVAEGQTPIAQKYTPESPETAPQNDLNDF